jgi:hypothetical protein
MPQEKQKSENYENLGGVNTKASAYLTGPRDALSIYNFDFSIMGDLTGRPGSTQYLSATFGGSIITGLYEFTRLSGFSKIIIGHPGGMWSAQDNSVSGFSISGIAATYSVFGGNSIGNDGINVRVPGVSWGSNQWDFVTFVDNMFMCDGRTFLKYNGSSILHYSLPRCVVDTINDLGVTGNVGHPMMTAGIYSYAFAWMNDRGFIGPVTNLKNVTVTGTSSLVWIGVSFPHSGFGITSMVVYRAYGLSAASTDYFNLQYFPTGGVTTYLDYWADVDTTGDGTIPNEYDPFMEGSSFVSQSVIFVGSIRYWYEEF